jgi:hypothetical protein
VLLGSFIEQQHDSWQRVDLYTVLAFVIKIACIRKARRVVGANINGKPLILKESELIFC